MITALDKLPTIQKVSTQKFKGSNTVKYTFGTNTLECPDSDLGLLPVMGVAAGYISPWTDAKKDASGKWELPAYDCEVKGLSADDPKNAKWIPGQYTEGVDNVTKDAEGNKIKEWNGFGLVQEGQDVNWDPSLYPEVVQKLVSVPQMPGQPMKEMFARLNAVEPDLFEDKHAVDIMKNLMPDWKKYIAYTKWAESFGIHTEKEPAEWKGQEMEVVPSVYSTPRADAVTLCVGISKDPPKPKPAPKAAPGKAAPPPEPEVPEIEDPWPVEAAEGAEYDFITHLYAKDQEGKVIAIFPYECHGLRKISFATVTFIPPKGTSSITPYASFKIRGVWTGRTIEWDPTVENPAMKWFTEMDPKMRKELGDENKLGDQVLEDLAAVRHKKSRKQLPVLWPENSWEGNALKARMWDQLNK